MHTHAVESSRQIKNVCDFNNNNNITQKNNAFPGKKVIKN
jgi:hypothetical protein